MSHARAHARRKSVRAKDTHGRGRGEQMLSVSFSRTPTVNLRIRAWCRIACSHRKMSTKAAMGAEEPKLKVYNSLTKSKVVSVPFLQSKSICYNFDIRSSSSREMDGMSNGTTVVPLFTTRRTWDTPGELASPALLSFEMNHGIETMSHRISSDVF